MWPQLSLQGLTTFDLTVVALVFGPVLLLGIPLIKTTAKQPARCELEPVDPQTLSRAQTRWLQWLDERMAHQVECGLLTPEQQGYHRPTTRLAIRSVADFFNPFGDTFTWARLAAALLAGLALPMVALCALRLPEVTAVAQLANALSVSWNTGLTLALAPALLVAGGSLGWVFQDKSLIWCFLLPYLGSPPRPPSRASELGASGLLPHRSVRRHRRAPLLEPAKPTSGPGMRSESRDGQK